MNPDISICDPMQDPYNRERALSVRIINLEIALKTFIDCIEKRSLPAADGEIHKALSDLLENNNGRND